MNSDFSKTDFMNLIIIIVVDWSQLNSYRQRPKTQISTYGIENVNIFVLLTQKIASFIVEYIAYTSWTNRRRLNKMFPTLVTAMNLR